MDDMYAAILRIQELEKDLCAATKRAEHAEASVQMMRKTNKDLEKKSQSAPIPSGTSYAMRYSFDDSLLLDNPGEVQWIRQIQLENYSRELGEWLIEQGYVHITEEQDYDRRERRQVVQVIGTFNVGR